MLVVDDIMTLDPATVSPATPLGEAIGSMKRCGCRQLPVVDQGNLVGIVTDRDIRLAMNSPLILHEREDDQYLLTQTPVESCMTTNPLTIEANLPASEAAQLMMTYKFGALPVVHEGQLVGILTVTDILRSFITLAAAADNR
jgi:acetoin utilization protein AcuB